MTQKDNEYFFLMIQSSNNLWIIQGLGKAVAYDQVFVELFG